MLGCKETNGVEHSMFLRLMRATHLDGTGMQPSPHGLGQNRENVIHPSHEPFDARDCDLLVRQVYFYNSMYSE